MYNKVGGVVVTGNEDGAHAAAETTVFNSPTWVHDPANADTYWSGCRPGRRSSTPAREAPVHAQDATGWRTTSCTWPHPQGQSNSAGGNTVRCDAGGMAGMAPGQEKRMMPALMEEMDRDAGAGRSPIAGGGRSAVRADRADLDPGLQQA